MTNKPFRVENRRFATLQEAKDYANKIWKKTGVIVAITEKA